PRQADLQFPPSAGDLAAAEPGARGADGAHPRAPPADDRCYRELRVALWYDPPGGHSHEAAGAGTQSLLCSCGGTSRARPAQSDMAVAGILAHRSELG